MLPSPQLSRPIPFGISLLMIAAVTACGGGNGASAGADATTSPTPLEAPVATVSPATIVDTPAANLAAMEISVQALAVRVKAPESAPVKVPVADTPAASATTTAVDVPAAPASAPAPAPAPITAPTAAPVTTTSTAPVAAPVLATVAAPAPAAAPATIAIVVNAPITTLPTTGRISKTTMTSGWPQIDTSKLQTGAPGIGYDKLGTTDQPPGPSDGTGAFRTVCEFSHMAFDDPIVYPGQPGKSHLHAFFGNTGTNAKSTADSIAHTGNSTCRGGTINRTGYWAPAMIDTGTGVPVKPDALIVYYKTGYGGLAPSTIQVAPQGLRMIAGNPSGSAPVQWGPQHFVCSGPKGDSQTYNIPTDCAVGSVVWSKVTFPQCWDGVNLDSPDHRSHMAYPSRGACPSTHPVPIPEITTNVLYTVTDAAALKRWRLASDTYDKGIPAGYSSHSDWFNGWKPDVMKTWVTLCDQPAKDCAAHLLGNGQVTL